ncbi:hypothetical protein SASPL_157593 [Salvia splendens]|uniref:SAUR family protein n=1 Tax=Salvia splendens TaxID=180675 RepID=A0A8X8VUN3_SALSN|nr:hypothetical protein SASPL_157593 [Salvia splendens]
MRGEIEPEISSWTTPSASSGKAGLEIYIELCLSCLPEAAARLTSTREKHQCGRLMITKSLQYMIMYSYKGDQLAQGDSSHVYQPVRKPPSTSIAFRDDDQNRRGKEMEGNCSSRKKTHLLPGEDGSILGGGGEGAFVVYASDGVRFSFPIGYLSCLIFRELLRMSEEEFGHPRNGPITFPCDSQVLRYVASLMEKNAAEEVEKAFLLSMTDCRCSSPYYLKQQQQCQHILLAGC